MKYISRLDIKIEKIKPVCQYNLEFCAVIYTFCFDLINSFFRSVGFYIQTVLHSKSNPTASLCIISLRVFLRSVLTLGMLFGSKVLLLLLFGSERYSPRLKAVPLSQKKK